MEDIKILIGILILSSIINTAIIYNSQKVMIQHLKNIGNASILQTTMGN
jgi:hypothetical protein